MDKYSQFVADNADSYKDKYTCEDYALAMMIRFRLIQRTADADHNRL